MCHRRGMANSFRRMRASWSPTQPESLSCVAGPLDHLMLCMAQAVTLQNWTGQAVASCQSYASGPLFAGVSWVDWFSLFHAFLYLHVGPWWCGLVFRRLTCAYNTCSNGMKLLSHPMKLSLLITLSYQENYWCDREFKVNETPMKPHSDWPK